MNKILLRLVVSMGFLVLSSHTAIAQWEQIDNNIFRPFSPTSLAVSGGYLYAGAMGDGLFRCSENNTAWTMVSGLPSINVHYLAVSGSSIFAATLNRVYRSTDSGTNWTVVDSGLTNMSVSALAVSGNGNVFAGTGSYSGYGSYYKGGIFLSTDNGTSWTAVNSGLPANTSIRSFAVSGNNVFAGTDSDGVFLSADNGAHWTEADAGLPRVYYARLAASGNNIFCGCKYGVYRSSNFGTSWTAVNSGLPANIWVFCFAVSGGNIFAGADSGIFVSTNGGTSWTGCNSGLSIMSVVSLAVGESHVFASLTAHAMSFIWRRPLSEIVSAIHDSPAHYQSQQGNLIVRSVGRNDSKVLLEFFLSNPGYANLTVYDITGREIATLVNKNLCPGTHRFVWDTRNVAAGCYTARMQTGSNTSSRSIPIFR
jgi:hypothetical protein